MIDLTIVWAIIIVGGVMIYTMLDGFDLGVGVLFATLTDPRERAVAVNAIAPVWDGNETWLVLGGGGLFAAFPLAYAIILPALYAPLVAMLLALVLRGVAFEFRGRDPAHMRFWDFGFSAGSTVAALAQGVMLGAILQGIRTADRSYAGGWWDWLTPFSVLTGISLVAAYALSGACWLIMKAEGRLQDHARRLATKLFPATIAAIAAVSVATVFLRYDYWRRWFAFPNVLLTAQTPLLIIAVTALFYLSMRRRSEYAPFFLVQAIFVLCFAGLGVSIFPYVVPSSVTIWDAAAPPQSQSFMLIGAMALMPLILAYTGWSYWVFRGKATETGYH